MTINGNPQGGDIPPKLSAIAALTWVANSLIWLVDATTPAVQALAAHVVTFIQSASAADARTAIGAGTGNGDVTGPGSSTDNAIPRFDSTTGKIIQQGYSSNTPTIGDTGIFNIPSGSIELVANGTYYITLGSQTTIRGPGRVVIDATGLEPISSNTKDLGRQAREWQSLHGWGFLSKQYTGITTGTAVLTNAAGDVTVALSGTFLISDGAGNSAGGVITKTAPGGTFNLYDDGGTNTCQLQVAADGSVTLVRTAGSRTYACSLTLNWI